MTSPENDTQQLNRTTHITPPPRGGLSFVPPLWALLLMVLTVALTVGGLLILIYAIGASTPEPSQPNVIVTNAPPEPTATPAPLIGTTAVATDAGSIPLPDFALEGPTLPPVFLSPTPDAISIGRTVLVINVGEGGLNVRENPGINNALLFTADEGTLLEVVAGPESAAEDSFTWWRIRDVFTDETGWAVQLYMEVQPEGNTP